jgi:hypothetical protein
MWPAATMFALGFLLCPFPALSPSGRNLTALLPELRDLIGSLYRHCRREFSLLASTRRRRWRAAWLVAGGTDGDESFR